MVYLITYDLNKEGQDYESIYNAIEALGENIHPLESLWFVESDSSSEEISNTLCNVVDDNDLLFVSKILFDYAGNLDETDMNWIKNKISPSIYA